MSDKNRVFRIAAVYTALILGAGFASGQELLNFFVKFDDVGFLGLVFSGILFVLVGWATLSICYEKKIMDYDRFVDVVMGHKLGFFMKWIAGFFLFFLFATMLAAGGAAVNEMFGLPFVCGVLAMALFCYVTFLFNLEGLIEINTVLAPIMVLGGVFIGFYSFAAESVPVFFGLQSYLKENWFVASITYASYNIVTAVSVLAAMGHMVTKKKIAFWGGLTGGLAMTVLGVCLALPLFIRRTSVLGFEIPLLQIVSKYHFSIQTLYFVILIAAIYTTAIANGFAFIEFIYGKLRINKKILKLTCTLCAVLAAQMGFSTFVSSVYPLFGVFGFFEACIILLVFFRGNR